MSITSVETRRRHRRLRLLSLLTLGVLVISGTVVWRHFRYARPIGTGPAGPTVDRDKFAEPWSDRPVVLLGLGDSVTQGLGASPGLTDFGRIQKNPASEFGDMQGIALSHVFPKLTAKNLAISGTTSIECVDYQLPKLEVHDEATFGVVVITTGGNDVIHNYGRTPPREGAMFGASVSDIREWITSFGQRLQVISNRVLAAFPGGCHIFIANIYDPTDATGDIEHAGLPAWKDGIRVLAEYNRALKQFADQNAGDVTLVDIRSEFLGHGIHCTQFWHPHYRKSDPHYWYWDNLEDPNDRGYDAIRRLFLIEMARILPEKLGSSQGDRH